MYITAGIELKLCDLAPGALQHTGYSLRRKVSLPQMLCEAISGDKKPPHRQVRQSAAVQRR